MSFATYELVDPKPRTSRAETHQPPSRLNYPSLSLYKFYNSIFEGVIADTEELKRECYRLRYMVYCVENDWLRGCNLYMAEQIERDEYDDHSVHALLRHRETGLFIGTVRLILHPQPATAGTFPIHKLCAENNLQLPTLIPLKNLAEISRFCIAQSMRRRVEDSLIGSSYDAKELASDRKRLIPAMSLGLISMLFLMAKKNDVRHWCAEMEPFLIELLAKLGIYFDPIGPMIEFHGQRQICHKPLDAWIDRIAEEKPEIWNIITDEGRYI